MKRVVKIRFLGSDWWQGVPRKRSIKVGLEIFWNYPKFQEQDAEAAYIRPLEFYQKHKDILSDTSKFIITFVGEDAEDIVVGPGTVLPSAELTEDLDAKGVILVDGILFCPSCDYQAASTINMKLHMVEHAG